MDAPSKCPQCGTELLPGSTICMNCGFVLPEEDPEKPTVMFDSDSVTVLPAGTLLNNGRYEINNLLGQGGFGITYDGTDRTLNAHVAIKEYFPKGLATRHVSYTKTVSSSSGEDKLTYQRGLASFLREAQNLAKFSGEENFVHVSNFFQENGTAYIVMEFVDGITIADYLKEHGTMSFKECMQYMKPIMRALDKVHQQHMIHRDVSPSNIMILKDRRVKLLDFGAATEVSYGSKTLSVILRPDYSPIEQYSAHRPQGSYTDVYATCATMYTMLTNQVPMTPVMRLSTRQPLTRPSAYGAEINREQEDVLMKGLAIQPEDRIQTMTELMRLFDEASRPAASPAPYVPPAPTPTPPAPAPVPAPAPAPPSPPPSPSGGINWKVIALFIIDVLLFAGIIWLLMRVMGGSGSAMIPDPPVKLAAAVSQSCRSEESLELLRIILI